MQKLVDSLTQRLIDLPETGMGYQIVEATYRDHHRQEAVVLNGSLIEPIVGNVRDVMERIFSEDVQYVAKSASFSSEIVDVKILGLPPMFKSAMFRESLSADSAIVSSSIAFEVFIRFSPFLDDKRITSDKGLMPGTYSTTHADARYCLENDIDPISRYALPSTRAVNYAFRIEPPVRTELKRGIVQPANGQPGGGKEVLFLKGSPSKTVTRTYDLTLKVKL